MPVLTAAPEHRAELAARLAEDSPLVTILFCAAWCNTCAEIRAAYERIANARPQHVFVWLDIEDNAEICDEVDIENFPTLAVFRGTTLRHFGVSLPQEATIARLVDELAQRSGESTAAPQAVFGLPARLARHAGL